jgi:threonine dehydratase
VKLSLDDVRAAAARVRVHVAPSPLRSYAPLDAEIGHGVKVWVKHENHLPTGAFKARNAVSALSNLGEAERRRGVVAATRGNHGQGLAWAGARLGIPVTICVPLGNNPEKNAAIVGFGARLIEEGRDYDEAAQIAARLVAEQGLTLVHSTNNRDVIAGASTLALEMLEERPELEAIVVAVGGGSQAVGCINVARALAPGLLVFGVQAENAAAGYASWKTGERVTTASADTFADGLATRASYDATIDTLREGLAGFVTVTEREIAHAIRVYLRTTHNLAEGAGAAGLAGLVKLAPSLAHKTVGVILSGGNIDQATLVRVLSGDLA